jgi:hypothetical protein
MHECIYSFVGGYFDRKLDLAIDELTRQHCRLHDGTSSRSLFRGLCHIRKTYTFDVCDDEIRFQYHEVAGPRRTSSITRSKVVLEAAAYFYAKLYKSFQTMYGNKMSQEVMIVCHFAETVEWWDHVIEQRLLTTNKSLAAEGYPALSRNHHPRIISNSDDKDI